MAYYDVANGPQLNGEVYQGYGSVAPYEILLNGKGKPIPAVISGTTFTLNASETNPQPLWLGKEFSYLQTSLSYVFADLENEVIDSNGNQALSSAALGIWYVYAFAESGEVKLRISQTAPAKSPVRFNESVLNHPGVNATTVYSYVGFFLCTNAGTPTVLGMTKVGNKYLIAEADVLSQQTPGTSFALMGFTGAEALPAHDGVKVSGYITTAAADTAKIAYDASGSGVLNVTSDAGIHTNTFEGLQLNAGDFYGAHTTAAGTVTVSTIEDIV